jgi:hypothetical protein
LQCPPAHRHTPPDHPPRSPPAHRHTSPGHRHTPPDHPPRSPPAHRHTPPDHPPGPADHVIPAAGAREHNVVRRIWSNRPGASGSRSLRSGHGHNPTRWQTRSSPPSSSRRLPPADRCPGARAEPPSECHLPTQHTTIDGDRSDGSASTHTTARAWRTPAQRQIRERSGRRSRALNARPALSGNRGDNDGASCPIPPAPPELFHLLRRSPEVGGPALRGRDWWTNAEDYPRGLSDDLALHFAGYRAPRVPECSAIIPVL